MGGDEGDLGVRNARPGNLIPLCTKPMQGSSPLRTARAEWESGISCLHSCPVLWPAEVS